MSLTDATLLYASYRAATRAAGFNPPFDRALFPDTAATYEPEYIDAFEIGAKNTLLDNTLQANITAFFTTTRGCRSRRSSTAPRSTRTPMPRSTGLNRSSVRVRRALALQRQHRHLHTGGEGLASVDTRDPTAGRSDVTLIVATTSMPELRDQPQRRPSARRGAA
ncbi:MAG: TonB-dependent receptor [Gammaproteobacteria bacterium]|nr:TonB-dependent receptor [Gammaproteobacteria bacterium]